MVHYHRSGRSGGTALIIAGAVFLGALVFSFKQYLLEKDFLGIALLAALSLLLIAAGIFVRWRSGKTEKNAQEHTAIQDLETVSLKGRVAFGIRCFENVLLEQHYDTAEWEPVLEKLWLFTSIRYLDDWSDMIAEILPENLLEFRAYERHDFEHLDEESFERLYRLYQTADEKIDVLMTAIYNIGTSHAYSRIEGNGGESLRELEKLIEYMAKIGVSLPDAAGFKQFSISENKGWGNSFDGKKISRILGQDSRTDVKDADTIRTIGKWMIGIAGILLSINLISRLADVRESMEYIQVMGRVTKVQTIAKWTRAGSRSTKLSSYCVWVNYQPQGYPLSQTITETYSDRLFSEGEAVPVLYRRGKVYKAYVAKKDWLTGAYLPVSKNYDVLLILSILLFDIGVVLCMNIKYWSPTGGNFRLRREKL